MILIGIGSNKSSKIGKPIDNVIFALQQLNNNRIKTLSISSVYLTSPLQRLKQGHYYNQVVEVDTYMNPKALLMHLHSVERMVDKRSMKNWASRGLDLDLLSYKGVVLSNKLKKKKNNNSRYRPITLPHPELEKRLFNLKAIEEICPFWHHPKSKIKIGELIKKNLSQNYLGGEKLGGEILSVFTLYIF